MISHPLQSFDLTSPALLTLMCPQYLVLNKFSVDAACLYEKEQFQFFFYSEIYKTLIKLNI